MKRTLESLSANIEALRNHIIHLEILSLEACYNGSTAQQTSANLRLQHTKEAFAIVTATKVGTNTFNEYLRSGFDIEL